MSEWKSERREHARTDIICSVTLTGKADSEKIRGEAINLSDCGAMFTIPMRRMADLTPNVKMKISVPRATANTHMLEQVATEATVVRHQPMVDEELAGVAVRFSTPLNLQLEV